MVTTAPSPQPQQSPAPTSATVGGVTFDTSSIDNTGQSSSSAYGLGAWGSARFLVSGLLPTGDPNGMMSGDDIMHTFAMLGASGNENDHQIVGAIQQALRLAGYYSDPTSIRPGVVQPSDLTALSEAVKVLGQAQGTPNASGATPQTIPLGTFLTQAAQNGVVYSAAAAQRKAAVIQAPNDQNTFETAQQVFQSELGRKLSDKEARAFAAAYRKMVVGVQEAQARREYAIQNGQQQVPQGPQGATSADWYAAINGANQPPASIDNMASPTPGSPADFRMGEEASMQKADPNYGLGTSQGTFANTIQGALQAESQASGQGAAPTGPQFVVEQQPPDATTAALQYADKQHPTEALAHSVAQQFQNFLSIITKG